ncbi:MAG: hypothetical protein M0R75_01645 [Dehalococcoidia bacterium]|nr:hypothetical protein [Dehalococcoidia bacterium]
MITQLFSPDLNLSPEARTIIAYVATISGTEISFDRLMRLIHVRDEKKLRRSLAEAEDAGWIAINRHTGRGHNPLFEFTPPKNGTLSDRVPKNGGVNSDDPTRNRAENPDSLPKNGTLSDSPPKNGTLNADRVPKNGGVNDSSRVRAAFSSSTTSSSPSVSPNGRARDAAQSSALAALVTYLGEHASAVHQMLGSADHPPLWPAAVMGKYGPGGTQLRLLSGIPPDRQPAVLATAMMEWATGGKPFENRHFDGYVRKAAEHERDGGTGGSGGDHRGATRRAAHPAPSGTPAGAGPGRKWHFE